MPKNLLQPPPAIQTKKLQGYVTPMSQNWEALLANMEATGLPLLTALTKDDLESLAIVDLKVTYRSRRGGHAEITSKQKTNPDPRTMEANAFDRSPPL